MPKTDLCETTGCSPPLVRVTVAAGLEREQGEEEGAGVRVAKGGQVEPEAGEQGEGGQGEPESEEQGEER